MLHSSISVAIAIKIKLHYYSKTTKKTRMHSSRMRTARPLTLVPVCMLGVGGREGVVPGGGGPVQGEGVVGPVKGGGGPFSCPGGWWSCLGGEWVLSGGGEGRWLTSGHHPPMTMWPIP